MKKILFKFINNYLLNYFGFEISRRNDTSVSQFKSLFNDKKLLRIIDCGAYKGNFTEEFQISFPNTSALCIEPSPQTFSILNQKFKHKKNVILENKGLYSSTKEGNLNINESDKTNSLLKMDKNIPKVQIKFHKNKNSKMVKLVTLDSLTEKHHWLGKTSLNIDLLKIDVQGSELDLLLGATKTLSKTDNILIEIHFIRSYEKSPLFSEIYSFLCNKGFIFKRFYDLVHDPQDRTRLIYGDALFSKK